MNEPAEATDTEAGEFVPDSDPSTTTDPTKANSDRTEQTMERRTPTPTANRIRARPAHTPIAQPSPVMPPPPQLAALPTRAVSRVPAWHQSHPRTAAFRSQTLPRQGEPMGQCRRMSWLREVAPWTGRRKTKPRRGRMRRHTGDGQLRRHVCLALGGARIYQAASEVADDLIRSQFLEAGIERCVEECLAIAVLDGSGCARGRGWPPVNG